MFKYQKMLKKKTSKNVKKCKNILIIVKECKNMLEHINKAGYTANTSCGRVGRGGNGRFHTFRLVLTDQPTDRRTDGQSLL